MILQCFLSWQSVMKIMSEEDKGRYTYFQRRLAEFQSKIEKYDRYRTPLGNTKMLDITGAEGRGSVLRYQVP